MVRRMYNDIRKFGIMEEVYFVFSKLFDEEAYSTLYMQERDKVYSGLSSAELKNEISEMYRIAMNREIDLDNPISFTEKIQWLKIYDNVEAKKTLADKYCVRKWIEKKIGKEYLIPLLGVWKNPKEFCMDLMPDSFVIKANHGSGMNYIVKDKNAVDEKHLRKLMNYWLKRPFWAHFIEPQYRYINKRIIAEKYVEELSGGLYDYKIHCFNGTPLFIQCIGDRDLISHTGFQQNYDLEWKKLDWIFEDYPAFTYDVKKPDCLNQMIKISEKLSAGFKYVRVDLYDIKGHVYFGEMTFTPANGIYPYRGTWNRQVDLMLGKNIIL